MLATVHAGEENYPETHMVLEYARACKSGELSERIARKNQAAAAAAAAVAAAAAATGGGKAEAIDASRSVGDVPHHMMATTDTGLDQAMKLADAQALFSLFYDDKEFMARREDLWQWDNGMRAIDKVSWSDMRSAKNDPSLTQEQAMLACLAILDDAPPSMKMVARLLQSPDAAKFAERLLKVGYEGYTGKRIATAIAAVGGVKNFSPADAGKNKALRMICEWLASVFAFARKWSQVFSECTRRVPALVSDPRMPPLLFMILRGKITHCDASGLDLGDLHAIVLSE